MSNCACGIGFSKIALILLASVYKVVFVCFCRVDCLWTSVYCCLWLWKTGHRSGKCTIAPVCYDESWIIRKLYLLWKNLHELKTKNKGENCFIGWKSEHWLKVGMEKVMWIFGYLFSGCFVFPAMLWISSDSVSEQHSSQISWRLDIGVIWRASVSSSSTRCIDSTCCVEVVTSS